MDFVDDADVADDGYGDVDDNDDDVDDVDAYANECMHERNEVLFPLPHLAIPDSRETLPIRGGGRWPREQETGRNARRGGTAAPRVFVFFNLAGFHAGVFEGLMRDTSLGGSRARRDGPSEAGRVTATTTIVTITHHHHLDRLAYLPLDAGRSTLDARR